MKTKHAAPATIDEYIAASAPSARPILERIRATVRKAAPRAEEAIRYGMPTFLLDGPVAHFGAFKKHIGFYPPVRDRTLKREASVYAGDRGSLRFALDAPVPYPLIGRIVKARVRELVDAKRQKRGGQP